MSNYQSTRESAPLLPQNTHSIDVQSQNPSVDKLRDAFARRDILQSIELHNQRQQSVIPNENHAQAEDHLHYNGQISSAIQGVIISLVIIQAGFSAQQSISLILLFCLSSTFAAGFGLTVNDILTTISERMFCEQEASREKWELEVNLEGEVAEMTALYVEKGMAKETAEKIWECYSEHPKIFLEAMMAAEIGKIYPQPPFDAKLVLKHRFFAFFIGSIIPCLNIFLFQLISKWITFDRQFYALVSFFISLGALFYLGSRRNRCYPMTAQSDSIKLNNGLQSLIYCGCVAAIVGFLIGKLFFYGGQFTT